MAILLQQMAYCFRSLKAIFIFEKKVDDFAPISLAADVTISGPVAPTFTRDESV